MADDAPPFLPPSMLQAIGNLAAYWAYLESDVEVAIWCFLSVPREIGAPVTTHMGMVNRCQVLRALALQRFGNDHPAFVEFDALLGEIENARIIRNEIIHAFWHHTPEGEAAPFLKVTARGAFREQMKEITAHDIRTAVANVWDLSLTLQGAIEAIFPDARLPWPRVDEKEDHQD